MTTLESRRYVPADSRPSILEREFGEIAPGCSLVENGGVYAIMHEGTLILKFPSKPTPDPDPENVCEDGPILDASTKWIDEVMEWVEGVKVKPETSYILCKAARKAGWVQGDEYGHVLMWFYDRAGRSLDRREER